MSVVIEFPSSRSERRSGPATGSGEVVIFPGVRIERREFNLADRIAPARRRPLQAAQAAELDESD